MRQSKRVVISLTSKYWTSLEKRAKNKRSSLLCPAVKDKNKNLLYWVSITDTWYLKYFIFYYVCYWQVSKAYYYVCE
jgi:hypothetical protein